MPRRNEVPEWLTPALFDGGYGHITVEFTTHLAGRSDELMIGVAIYDTATREPIAIEAFPFQSDLADLERAAEWMAEVLQRAHRCLSPF